MCLSWLNDNTPDSWADILGFTAIWVDRDPSTSGKRKGGFIVLFFNQRWVNPRNVTIVEMVCCPDIKLLSVGFRAFYAPREFPCTVIIVVYVHLQRCVTSSMLGYRPNILRHSLQSQGISLYPPAWLALFSMWSVKHRQTDGKTDGKTDRQTLYWSRRKFKHPVAVT